MYYFAHDCNSRVGVINDVFISGNVDGGAVIRITIYIEFTAPETDE